MAETFVRDDINNYVARNIFGRFSKRSAIAALAAVAVVSVGIYGVYAWDCSKEGEEVGTGGRAGGNRPGDG